MYIPAVVVIFMVHFVTVTIIYNRKSVANNSVKKNNNNNNKYKFPTSYTHNILFSTLRVVLKRDDAPHRCGAVRYKMYKGCEIF